MIALASCVLWLGCFGESLSEITERVLFSILLRKGAKIKKDMRL